MSYVVPCQQGTAAVGVTRARADERRKTGPASSESRPYWAGLQRATGSVHKWDDRATGTQGLRSAAHHAAHGSDGTSWQAGAPTIHIDRTLARRHSVRCQCTLWLVAQRAPFGVAAN